MKESQQRLSVEKFIKRPRKGYVCKIYDKKDNFLTFGIVVGSKMKEIKRNEDQSCEDYKRGRLELLRMQKVCKEKGVDWQMDESVISFKTEMQKLRKFVETTILREFLIVKKTDRKFDLKECNYVIQNTFVIFKN